MNFIKYSIGFSLLIFGLFSNAVTVCRTNGASGEVILRNTDSASYCNGRIYLSGYQLNNFFADKIAALIAKGVADCYGVDVYVCEVRVRLDLRTKDVFVGGRFDPGMIGFSEAGGFKLKSTFNGQPDGKDWFFNYCEER